MEKTPETVEQPSPWSSPASPAHSVQPEQLKQKLEQLQSDQKLNQKIEELEQDLAQDQESKGKSKEDNEEADLDKEPERSGDLSYDSDDIYNATPIATPNLYSVLFESNLSDEEEHSEAGASKAPGQEKEYEQPETSAQTASFDYGATSPMRDDNGKQDKETGQARVPSHTSSSNGSDGTVTRQRPNHSSEPGEPAANQKGQSWFSPEEGQEASTSTSTSTTTWKPQTAINPQAPIFITMDDEAPNGSFRPFINEAAPIPGEHMADTMIRDQIRRCELQLQRPLTDQQKAVIRTYYQDMRQRRAPDEASVPTTIYSLNGQPLDPAASSRGSESSDSNNAHNNTHWAPAPAARAPLPWDDDRPATPPTGDVSMVEHFHAIAYELERKVKTLERELKETADQHIVDRFRLDSACEKIGQLHEQRRVNDQKVATIVRELMAAKAELAKLKAGEPHQVGGFTLLTLALAMVMLVWLVTEAMLHSKRLSDGFGPYINGGYNGLGSVLIFGSWFKFLMFNAVALYLGYFSVRGVAW